MDTTSATVADADRRAPLYDAALRARRLWRRVRRGRGRALARPGPAAGPRRPGRPRPSRRVRGRRRVERRRRRLAPARSVGPRARWPAPSCAARPARPSSCCSCRAAATAERAARTLVERDLRRRRAAGRRPGAPSRSIRRALGAAAAAASRPTVAQADRRPARRARRDDPRPLTDDAFERRLVLARRRLETRRPRRRRRPLRRAVRPVRSCRTIVYKGLVAGGRLADLYPDLRAPLEVGLRDLPPALRHEHARRPGALAQPFRSIAHNGEINTVRGNREQVRGRTRDLGARPIAAELRAAGPLLSPDGSDSLSLDEGLELLTDDRLGPRRRRCWRPSPRRSRSAGPRIRTSPRSAAGRPGMLAPWDGPAAIVFADGRRVGALIDRNGLRPAAFAVTRDRLVAVASEAGAVPFAAADTIRRGRLGPGELLLVEPGRRAILEDTEAKAWALRRLPIHDAPRPLHEDDAGRGGADRRDASPGSTTSPATSSGSTPSAPGSTSRRWRSRRTSRCGAWATTRRRPVAAASTGRSPTTSARRSPRSRTRRSTRSASGSSWTCGSSSAGGRRCSAGRRAGRGRSASSARSWPTSTGCSGRSATPAGATRVARRDVAGRRRRRRPGRRPGPPGADAVARGRGGRRGPRRRAMRGCRSSACRCRRSSPPAPCTPR